MQRREPPSAQSTMQYKETSLVKVTARIYKSQATLTKHSRNYKKKAPIGSF